MEQKKTTEPHFPLKILVRTAKGNFVQKDAPSAEDIKLGICVEQNAWLLVKIPTDRCSPDVFLKTVANLTGLPVHYPKAEDFAKLKEVFPMVTEICATLKKDERTNRGLSYSHIDNFNEEEERVLQNFLTIHRPSYIRLVINLDEL